MPARAPAERMENNHRRKSKERVASAQRRDLQTCGPPPKKVQLPASVQNGLSQAACLNRPREGAEARPRRTNRRTVLSTAVMRATARGEKSNDCGSETVGWPA